MSGPQRLRPPDFGPAERGWRPQGGAGGGEDGGHPRPLQSPPGRLVPPPPLQREDPCSAPPGLQSTWEETLLRHLPRSREGGRAGWRPHSALQEHQGRRSQDDDGQEVESQGGNPAAFSPRPADFPG